MRRLSPEYHKASCECVWKGFRLLNSWIFSAILCSSSYQGCHEMYFTGVRNCLDGFDVFVCTHGSLRFINLKCFPSAQRSLFLKESVINSMSLRGGLALSWKCLVTVHMTCMSYLHLSHPESISLTFRCKTFWEGYSFGRWNLFYLSIYLYLIW